jgi:hypothetical protein
MSINVTAIGPQGILDLEQVPSAQMIDSRLRQAQNEVIRNMKNGGARIDEDRLLQAMYHSGPTPAEWAQQENANKQNIRDTSTEYWDSKGKQAKDQWLSETKIAQKDRVVSQVTQDTAPRATVVQGTSLNVSNDGFRSINHGEPILEPMGFLDAMKPGSIKTAYSDIMVDLRRWDELPQATGLEKIKYCFLSPERIGAIVCSCILMVTLVTFVVILTM